MVNDKARSELEYLNFITGFLQFQKGNSKLALAKHFQKTGEGNPYTLVLGSSGSRKNRATNEAAKKYCAPQKSRTIMLIAGSLALVREKAKKQNANSEL
ncbi:MAG: hypothetical protein MZV64_06525 [Ignavibacteriales bacterium]|nr:hypothetical protein [Ignavibacteriales bacterium]